MILTDGRDENNPGTAPGSTHTLEEVLKLRREVDAVIYAVGLGDKVDAPVLQRLADESGGQAYSQRTRRASVYSSNALSRACAAATC